MRKNYTFANTAEQIQALIEKYPSCAKAVTVARAEATGLMNGFQDSTDRISGWGHNFCCPKCASTMIFDFALSYNPPHTFTCPHCGTKAGNRDMDEAWVYTYRYQCACRLESVALLAVLGDGGAYEFMEKFIDFYADRYTEFPVHGNHAGKGRIMGQSLDEAVWVITLLRAVHSCGLLTRISEEKKAYWYKAMFAPMAELLFPQANQIHNIPTWLMCAVGAIALTFGDNALLDRALHTKFGLYNQITGFTADGIWHECSLTYHYYTSEALTYFCSLLAVSAPDDPLMNVLEKIYTAPLHWAADGWQLQAVNDGWYPRMLSDFSFSMLRAARIIPALAAQSKMICERTPSVFETPANLFAICEDETQTAQTAEQEQFTLYPDTNFAFVTAPVRAILKSGVLCQSHMHCDYLSLIVPPFSDDLGTPGYGHPLTPSWYRVGASHNLVTVDGNVPYKVLSSHVARTENGVKGIVEPSAEWYNVHGERTLTANGETLCDLCRYEAPESHTFDWIFHSKGEVKFSCTGEAVETLGTGKGYEYFTDIRRMNAQATFTAEFSYRGETLLVTATVPQGTEVYTAKSPDNPADTSRTVILLRQTGKTAEFQVSFSYDKAPQILSDNQLDSIAGGLR